METGSKRGITLELIAEVTVNGDMSGSENRVPATSRVWAAALLLIFLGMPTGWAAAQEAVLTRVMVRALSNDAKVIGSQVGGARIVIEDAETGRVLAEGIQEGSTGDTQLIMDERPRRGAFETEGTAGFLATIELEKPTLVDITAIGPLGTPGRDVRTTKRMLLIPGVDVLGDGVIVELNGLTVELLTPAEGTPSGVAVSDLSIPVRAEVTMLCGCPTEPGGRWDSEHMRIVARLLSDGAPVTEAELNFSGETSIYDGELRAPVPGSYELEVVAMDPSTANFGRGSRQIRIGNGYDSSDE